MTENLKYFHLKKTPPSAIEAEKAVLGTMIMFNERIPEVIEFLSPNEFYGNRHKTIFETIVTMDINKKIIDIVTLSEALKDQIPADYISGLIDGIYKKINLNLYIKEIKNAYKLREIIHHGSQLVELAYRGNLEETIDYCRVLKPYAVDEDRGALSERARSWVELQTGYFSVADCYRALLLTTAEDRNNLNQIIYRLKNKGIIEPHGNRAGYYRRIENILETINWQQANGQEFSIVWPFDLNELVSIYPKSIVVIAGIFNAGKTSFCLDTIRLNQDKLKVNYFTSELGPNKLKQRLQKFENVEFPDGWKFNAIYRSANFADAIRDFPDDLNIFDYLELGTNFWEVGEIINKIFNRLNQGVAICCIQKSYGKDLGRGGDFSAEKASLYLTIDPGKLKIIKAKEWRGTDNPNGKYKKFKLIQGWKFQPDEDWTDEDTEQMIKQYEKSKNKGWFKT